MQNNKSSGSHVEAFFFITVVFFIALGALSADELPLLEEQLDEELDPSSTTSASLFLDDFLLLAVESALLFIARTWKK